MPRKNKQSRSRAYRLIAMSGLLLVSGCVLPIMALRSSSSTLPLSVITFMELLSLSALGLILTEVIS